VRKLHIINDATSIMQFLVRISTQKTVVLPVEPSLVAGAQSENESWYVHR